MPTRISSTGSRSRSRSASSARGSRPASARSWCRRKRSSRCATARRERARESSTPATCWCRWRWTRRPGTWCAMCPRCSASSAARPRSRRRSPTRKPTRSCAGSRRVSTSRVRRCCSSRVRWCGWSTGRSTTLTGLWNRCPTRRTACTWRCRSSDAPPRWSWTSRRSRRREVTMAKKVQGYIKLQVPAGSANPSPPIGPALGQQGVNIMEFCKQFNAQTQKMEKGLPIPVVITVYSDRSFTFVMKTPPAAVLIRKAIGIEKGSGTPNTAKVGKISRKQLEEIAKLKQPDLTAASLDAAVFTSGKNQEAAKAAGADIVGLEDLAAQVKAGEINFDRVIASPDAMRVVGQLGQILGPRGLMPNPKVGTVTPDVATAVKNAKAGQVTYRVDMAGIVHCTIGKASFDVQALKENLSALIADLQKAKPSASKGQYLKRVALSSTMGPGVVVDQATLG